ncbi:family 20 glycosylhydrolase [Streptosporangium sp. NPDC087985]|uniref:family 20 glycosylhydrolase n=1 Tax=Streptosporangium sp. NPDC087985 TaxID=3366196 RepID=UPI0038209BDF
MKISFLSAKREQRRDRGASRRPRARAVSALTIGALLATSLTGVMANAAQAGTVSTSPASPRIVPLPVSMSTTAESVNLALLPGVVASAKSQRMNWPDATYAPANAIDVFVHNGWTSNYASVGGGYDPTQDWFQVKLAKPAPVYEVFSLWTSPAKPTEYDLQVATDADCQTWSTVAHVVNPSDKDSQVIDRKDPISCVRMQALATNSKTGYTINEFEVWSGPKPAPVVGQIIPVPVQQTPGTGQPWELTAKSRIVVSGSGLAATAEVLADYLRPATGYRLPVVTGSATAADIALTLAPVPGLPQGNEVAAAEGYSLTVSSTGVNVVAPNMHGLFNGFQTLRQLLPAASHSPSIGVGPWTAQPITVVDYPRYAHRGLQLDPARNFLTVAEVRSMIDQLAALKGDQLHLHLSDSQSWRLEIKGYPALDGTGCNGAGCLAGFYTQEDFKDLVKYAADRFIEIVPELESPAHATAAVTALGGRAVMGCQGQTQTDRFCTNPNDPASARALAFWRDAIAQLAAISPAPIIHIGGDEAIGMPHEDYKWWIRQMEIIVNDNGKRMMGWNPALEGYAPNSTSINHYWSDYTGGGPALIKPEWFNQGRDVIVTPEYNAYLDFGYDGSPGRTPRTELLQSYSWDPEWVYEKYRSVWAQPAYGGPKAEDILGIEAPIWGEQMRGLATNEYMVFPRLAGILEKAWSPKVLTQDYDAYRQRLSVAGPRWAFANVNFGTISQVTWSTAAMGTVARFGVDKTLSNAPLARMTAGSIPPGNVAAVIDWGDGSPTEPASIAGRDYVASQRQGRNLMSVSGSHTYPADQVYRGTVTYSYQDQTWVVPFTATGVPSCTKTIIGPHSGPLTVSSGVTCLDDATITGPVTVRAGAGLYASGSEVRGPLTASGAVDVLLCGTTVSGPATLTGGARAWLGNHKGDCAPATIKGPVRVTGMTGQVTIDGSTVSGPLVLQDNTAATIVAGNHIGGPLSCAGNSPAPTNAGEPNTASGPKSGQCAGL